MNITKKNVFFLDGIGAVMSCLLTGLVLPIFSVQLGLEKEILYKLAFFPALFAVYSLTCHNFLKDFKPIYLWLIIIANLSYSLLTFYLVLLKPNITILGKSYLLIEIFVILLVVFIEYSVVKKRRKT